MRKLIIALLFISPLFALAQIDAPFFGTVVGKAASSSGTSLTGNYGGYGSCGTVCVNGYDSGNADIAFFTPFVAPSNSASWSTFNVWIGSPQTSAWWLGLYSDTTSSCTGSAPHCPSTLLCSYSSSSAPSTGWNSISLASMTGSCGTPSAGTFYHLGQLTNSGSQLQGTTGASAVCPGTGGLVSGYATGVSTTPPSSAPALAGGTEVPSSTNGNGCYDAYASVKYTSSAQYNVLSYTPGNSDTELNTPISIPPTQSGSRLIIVTYQETSSGITGIYDCTGTSACGSSTDTFTKIGSCTVVSSTTICMWYTDRATAGTNNVTMLTSTSSKYAVGVLEVQGTLASSSLDKYCYDATASSSTTISGCSSGTLSQAQEFAVGVVFNALLGTGNYSMGTFTGSGNWITLYTGEGPSGSPEALGLFTQTTTTTTAIATTGTYSISSGSNGIYTALATFK